MIVQSAVTSYKMAKEKIEAGAKEIYLGLAINKYKYISLNGRWRIMNGVNCQVEGTDELKRIINFAHKNDVKVLFTANMHYLRTSEEDFLDYLRIGKNCGVDYFIISNLDLISLVTGSDLNIPIVVGTFAFMPNVGYAKMMYNMGAVRIVFPHSIQLEEIRSIKQAIPELDLEIFAHIGGGNNCGRCMMLHSPIHKDISAGCRSGYNVKTPEGETLIAYRWFDAAADCSLCRLKDLQEAGVDVLKIVGRESPNPKFNAKITSIYVNAIKYLEQGKSLKEYYHYLDKYDLSWTMRWKPLFCEPKRCKYNPTEITGSYV